MRSGRFVGRALRVPVVVVLVAPLLGMSPVAADGAPGAPLPPDQFGVQAGDVPGFAPLAASVETLQDPHDQGLDQAFIQCAGTTPLLREFDSGPDATVGQMFGQGQNQYGTPVLAIGSAVFTDGSSAGASAAYAALAGSTLPRCWASTLDALNTAQGDTVPVRPSTVSALPTAGYGPATTGFAIDVDFAVLGSTVTGQFGITAVQRGATVVMLVTTAYGQTFPESIRGSVLSRIVDRLAGAAGSSSGPATSSSSGPPPSPCVVTTSTDAKATAAQRTVDLSHALAGSPLRLTQAAINQDGALTALPGSGPGSDEPGAAAQCQWLGAPVNRIPPYYFSNAITASLSIVPWASATLARQDWNATAAGHLATPPVGSPIGWSTADIGDAAGYAGVMPEDGNAVLDVLDRQYVFTISVQATSTIFDQSPAPWITLAKAVIADLTPASPAPVALPPQPQGCTPVTGGPDDGLAARLGDSPDWLGSAAPGATVLDGVLHDARDAAGFFNALDPTQIDSLVSSVLRFDSQNQPLYPAVWALVKADLESCWLSEAFVRTLVTTPDDNVLLNDLYRNLLADPAAAVGLLQPMTADEIALGLDGDHGVQEPDPDGGPLPVVDNEYGKLAGVALADDIAALLGEGKHFTLPAALWLNYLSALGYFDVTEPEAGGQGAKNLSDYSNGGWAVPNAVHDYIAATEPPPPPKSLDFSAGNQWVNLQSPLAGSGISTLANDIYGDPASGATGPPDTAGAYYFATWASSAAILDYLVAQPLIRLQEDAIIGLAEGVALLRTVFCAAGGDYTAAACFLQDAADAAKAALDGNQADVAYATPTVVKDAIEDPAAHELPALGVVFTLIDPALSGPSPETIAAAHAAAGSYLCIREQELEQQLANPISRILEYGKPVKHTSMPEDAYAAHTVQLTQPIDTFAYADGTDTGSGVFVLFNEVQALWRTLVNGQLSPSDYEKCGLGGQDPTLAQDQVALAGSGYAPNSLVTVTGHSVPAGLAVTRADAAGRFAIRIDPRPLGVGEHHIIATGKAPNGTAQRLTWTIHVGAAAHRQGSARTLITWLIIGAGVALLLATTLYFLRRRGRPSRAQPPPVTSAA